MTRFWQESRAREMEEQLVRLEAEIAQLKPSLAARQSTLEAAAANTSRELTRHRGFLTWCAR